MLGLEGQYDSQRDQWALDLVDPVNDIAITGAGYRVGMYMQDEWQIADAWTTTLGLRIDRNNITGTQLSPRVALIWRAFSDTTIKAMWGRAHRAPNAFESDYDDGFAQVSNKSLEGETINTLELNIDHAFSPTFSVRASAYHWNIDDLVTLGVDPVSGLSQYQSGSAIKARGLEFSAVKSWDSGARIRGSISWQDTGYNRSQDLVNSPDLLAKLNASAPLPVAGLRVGYEFRYDSSRVTLNGAEASGYPLSNLYVTTDRLPMGAELSLGIFNLFDEHYAHPGADTNWQNAFEQNGRSVRVKLGLRF